jgi:hypothetical protein
MIEKFRGEYLMKAQWLLLISLMVSSFSHTKWMEIPGSEKIKKVSIGNKNTIWGIGQDDQFPYQYDGKTFILKNKESGNSVPLKISTISVGPDGSVYANGEEPLPGNQNWHRGLYSYDKNSWNLRAEGMICQDPTDHKQYLSGFTLGIRNFGSNNLINLSACGYFKIVIPQGKTKVIEKSELIIPSQQETSFEGFYFDDSDIALDGTVLSRKITDKTITVLKWDGKNWKVFKTYDLSQSHPVSLSVFNKNDIWALFNDPAKKTAHVYKLDPKSQNFLQKITNVGENMMNFTISTDGTLWMQHKDNKKWYQWVE